jgi:hypothetical protein
VESGEWRVELKNVIETGENKKTIKIEDNS